MHNKNPYLENKSRYGIVPWWLIAGSNISESSLLIGNFNDDEKTAVANISKNFDCIDYLSFLDIDDGREVSEWKAFDVIVIKTLDQKKPLDLKQLSAKLKKLFDNFPIIILLESNPLHIKRFFKDPINIFKTFFFDIRKREIQSRFFDYKISKYETLSHDDDPHESFPPGTYFTNKNPFLKREKIKRLLLNSSLSRLFFNSQIWTMTRDRKLFLELLFNEVKENSKFKWERDEIRLLKLILNNGKIILSLTSKVRNNPEYIIIVPLFDHIINQRRNERIGINYLRSTKLASYFVDEIIEGKLDNLDYFAMKEFSGITVDRPNPRLDDMAKNAMEIIIHMADVNSLQGGTNPEKTMTDISSELTKFLIARYPFHEKTIRQIGKKLAHYHGLPLISFMHGDTKLENFVISQETCRVIGIIDLELVEFPGIPLIDLFYLITYNYHILYHESFYDAFTRIVKNELPPLYQNAIEDYCIEHKIADNQKTMCLILFFLHHFAKRLRFIEEDRIDYEEFQPGCELIQKILEDLPFNLSGNLN